MFQFHSLLTMQLITKVYWLLTHGTINYKKCYLPSSSLEDIRVQSRVVRSGTNFKAWIWVEYDYICIWSNKDCSFPWIYIKDPGIDQNENFKIIYHLRSTAIDTNTWHDTDTQTCKFSKNIGHDTLGTRSKHIFLYLYYMYIFKYLICILCQIFNFI